MRVDEFKFLKNKRNLKIVIGSLVAANTIITFTPSIGAHEQTFQLYELEQSMSADITLEEMKNMIYSSTKLTDEEKAYLYNEELFEDILPYINQSERMKFIYRSKFDNIDIKNINSLMFNTIMPYGGVYLWNPSHNIYVKNYNNIGDGTEDTLSHEYVHVTQDINCYSFFIEGTAEMISSEYFGGEIDCYRPTIKSLKVLMEIIGVEPIKQYVFTGDFSMIEERIKPNLTSQEYDEFIKCVQQELGPRSSDRNKELMKIYQTLYMNIYGESMKNNEVINLILSDNDTLVRPYFNERLGNSYYLATGKVDRYKTGDGVEYHYLAPISEKEKVFDDRHHLN